MLAVRLLFGAILVAALPAGATPVHFDEATHGDVNGQTFVLGEGLNTIAGQSILTKSPLGLDRDDFFATVQSGFAIVGLDYTVTLESNSGITFLSASLFMRPEGSPVTTARLFRCLVGTCTPFEQYSTPLPYSAGTFVFSAPGTGSTGTGTATIGWTVLVTVAAVPEPHGAVLMVISLSTLWALRRPRRRVE